MNIQEYSKLANQEESYWWHIGRLKIIEVYISKFVNNKKGLKILNVGCGTGGTIKTLERFGDVDNVDFSEVAIKYLKSRGYKKTWQADATNLPFGNASYDLVVAFDVLEHIKDDKLALKEWSRVLKKDGSIIISVPAYGWLWSNHDRVMHHYRRYDTAALRGLALKVKLSQVRISYAFFVTLPALILHRLASNLFVKANQKSKFKSRMPKFLNWCLVQIIYLEAKAHKRTTLPAGSSIFAEFKKLPNP